jgi:wobble nucleotide-excising tRNase
MAIDLRSTLNTKKNVLIFAYNGTGKTRLSSSFKDLGKNDGVPDTLYFNAFTEDLFYWNNDLDNDTVRELKFNTESHFFDGLKELEMANRIRPLLQRYADFDFDINHDTGTVTFNRLALIAGTSQRIDNIKVSRGEENIFIWCFFLAVAQLAIDEQEAYKWVKYIYIDDPISSLDDNNAIAVASHLAKLLMPKENKIRTVISTHHTLFFNVMWNEFQRERKEFQPYFLSKSTQTGDYTLTYTKDTPFYHHVALLKQLKAAADSDNLYTYHFNILRSILEKTATFHGFNSFSECIKQDNDDQDGIVYARIINVLSHGNYSLFEPTLMLEENKDYFKKILTDFMNNYKFNPELFVENNVIN